MAAASVSAAASRAGLAADLEHILVRTEPLWQELRGQRLFVTGGTGFFGKWLLESFAWINDRLNLGAQALVLSRDERRLRTDAPHLLEMPALRYLRGDVCDFEFPEGTFSHVIHAATTSAEATFNKEPPLAKIDTIAGGTRHVLDFAAKCGTKKFLLTSSGGAYGPLPEGMPRFHEELLGGPDITNPDASALGEAKRMSELLLRIYAAEHGFEGKIGRCFTFVGPYLQLDIHYAMGNFIRDAIAGGPLVVNGDGSPIRSYLYVADLMVWLWTLLFKGVSGRLYNVGSDAAISVGDAADLVAQLSGTSVVRENHPQQRPTAGPNIYVPDVQRIKHELGVEETIDLEQGIARSLAFYGCPPNRRG